MTAIDYTILVILVFFALLSYAHGLAAEVFSVLKWAVSLLGARLLEPTISHLFFSSFEPIWLRRILSFAIFFLIFYFVFSFFSRGITHILAALGLGGVNRILGVIVGVIKGLLVITLLYFLLSYTDFPQQAMWQRSLFLPYFSALLSLLAPYAKEVFGYLQHTTLGKSLGLV